MWIYTINDDNSARFILGEYQNIDDRTLICFGVNPSTASPEALDNTVRKVKTLSKRNDYQNWIMLNIYPQRATNPNDLHKACNISLHTENLSAISDLIAQFKNSDILFAYGNLIDSRAYLSECLREIITKIKLTAFRGQFLCIKRTKKGHPVHPLYQRNDVTFIDFTIEN